MIKIKYNNSDTFEEVNFSRNGNLITISPTFPHYTGFTTWRLDGKTQLGDFSDFDTVYRSDGYSITYSNDGSVYIEHQKPTEEELGKQSLLSEKLDLEQWLKAHDYVGVKIATSRATIEEYADIIALMSEKSNRINEINKLLNEHT